MISFILYDAGLLSLTSGEHHALEALTPQGIVETLSQQKALQKSKINLYLPPSFFIATELGDSALSSIPQTQLAQALSYQQEDLLPGCKGEMLVVASANEKHTIALWMQSTWVDELQLAFNQAGLELAYIALRSVLPASKNPLPVCVEDVEAEQRTLITLHDGGITNYATYLQADLEEADIRQEYEAKLADYSQRHQYIRLDKIEAWKAVSSETEVDKMWRFYPSAALQNKVKKRARIQRLVLGLGVLGLVLAVTFPFLQRAYQEAQLSQQIEDLETRGQSVLQARSELAGHTQYWEVMEVFPSPKVLSILHSLDQTIPQHSWLTALRLREGKLEIEGYSSDPAAVLEGLSALPDFENVAFSQASRQERSQPNKTFFGIRLQLRQGSDAYMERFFSP